MGDEERSLRETRTMTEKAAEICDEEINSRKIKLRDSWNSVEEILKNTDLSAIDKREEVVDELNLLNIKVSKYEKINAEFTHYLETLRTVEANSLLSNILDETVERMRKVNRFRDRISEKLRYETDNTDKHSVQTTSTTASMAAKIKADKVRLQMAEEEFHMLQSQAQLEEEGKIIQARRLEEEATIERRKNEIAANIALFRQKKELMAAEAELETLEQYDKTTSHLPDHEDLEKQLDLNMLSIGPKPARTIQSRTKFERPLGDNKIEIKQEIKQIIPFLIVKNTYYLYHKGMTIPCNFPNF